MNPTAYPKPFRFQWYAAVERRGMSVKDACTLFGISRKTWYKWYRADHGRLSVAYRPAGRQPNTKLTPDVCSLIDREKRLTNYGPLKMKLLLKRRLGLDHRDLSPLQETGFNQPSPKTPSLV